MLIEKCPLRGKSWSTTSYWSRTILKYHLSNKSRTMIMITNKKLLFKWTITRYNWTLGHKQIVIPKRALNSLKELKMFKTTTKNIQSKRHWVRWIWDGTVLCALSGWCCVAGILKPLPYARPFQLHFVTLILEYFRMKMSDNKTWHFKQTPKIPTLSLTGYLNQVKQNGQPCLNIDYK